MNNVDFNQFLAWEATTRDTIDFKTIYVDMTGDLIAGLLLSQIVYWHLPNRDGASKLRVKKNGEMWVAKKRTDWWDEIRITAYQYDRASQILKDKGLVEIELYRFNGSPTHHIRLIREAFLAVFRQNLKSISNCDENPIGDESNNITETTAKSTTENTTKSVCDFSELPPTNNPLSESNLPTEEPTNGKRNNLPEGDLLDCALHFATQDELKRPEGWRRVKKPIFEVCELVAELWFGGRIPLLEQGDDKRIKNWQWGAKKLLEYHDGDLGATKATLRGFYTHYVETNSTMALAGPHSLINVVSQFMAQNDTSKGGQKVLRIGR